MTITSFDSISLAAILPSGDTLDLVSPGTSSVVARRCESKSGGILVLEFELEFKPLGEVLPDELLSPPATVSLGEELYEIIGVSDGGRRLKLVL
jgi:hypothetical protein